MANDAADVRELEFAVATRTDLIGALDEEDVETVGDLPAEVFDRILSRRAAEYGFSVEIALEILERAAKEYPDETGGE